MAVESEPLFHPEVIRQQLRHFVLPEAVADFLPKLRSRAELISSGKADTLNEKQLLPDFLTDLFGTLLGYTGPVGGGDGNTMSRENLVHVDGQWADAVPGRFGAGKPEFVVAVEGKDSRNPLDRPHGGRRMSAVDQCCRYAINLPCDWILVTSMREITHIDLDRMTGFAQRCNDCYHDHEMFKREYGPQVEVVGFPVSGLWIYPDRR